GRAALETLYFRGDLVVHHKTGTVKSYALAQDCLPRELLEKMGASAPGEMPAEKVVRASAEGCLGELLYALSKG
ncbi:MAG: hypothetical protein IIV90_02485, partial [Oscillospiraceae bacterium]|nr:hypothetical protein [Oscillospiraceae bacterium]